MTQYHATHLSLTKKLYQEIRGQGTQAAFSQKSDIYAFGCILYRLCTLSDPLIIDDIKPSDITADYSIELLSLISSMLGTDRDERPTATQIKNQLAAIGLQMFTAATLHCSTCHETFPSRTQLAKHHKKTGHSWKPTETKQLPTIPAPPPANRDAGLKIRGVAAHAPAEANVDPSPCIVCRRHFNTKKQFFGHLYGVHHYRGLKYVRKRRADDDVGVDEERHEKRVAQ